MKTSSTINSQSKYKFISVRVPPACLVLYSLKSIFGYSLSGLVRKTQERDIFVCGIRYCAVGLRSVIYLYAVACTVRIYSGA